MNKSREKRETPLSSGHCNKHTKNPTEEILIILLIRPGLGGGRGEKMSLYNIGCSVKNYQ